MAFIGKAKKDDAKKVVKAKKTEKKQRIPVSGNRDVLTARGKETGWVYRWVNDTNHRILTFKEGGFEHVDSTDIDIGSIGVDNPSIVGGIVSKEVGQGTTAYLMRIKQEFYDEDQKVKTSKVDATEEALNEKLRELTGRYGGIEINR